MFYNVVYYINCIGMKSRLIILILFFTHLNLFIKAQSLTVGTYNLRLDIESDKENSWKHRSDAVSSLIRFHDFDILGTQEAFKHQIQDILTALPYYSVYRKGRDDGKHAGEHSSIFY